MSKLEGRPDDPDLAPDAALAEDLGDEEERRKAQLAYYGGEEDDIDSFDPEGLDDGSDPNYTPKEADDEKDGEASAEAGEEESADAEKAAEKPDAGEPEKAAEGDGEEAGESDPKDAPKDEKPAQGIPKHRFDEVNERRKAAEEELARLKAEREAEAKAEKEEYDFDAAEMEYQELLLDGKTDEALAKRREIRAAEHATWKAEAKTETKQEISQSDAQAELASMSREAESMFPVFDKNHDDFDPAITHKVLVYMRGYVAEDMSPTDAFVTALADVIEQYDLDERYKVFGEEEKPEAKPEEKPAPPKKDPKKAEVRKQSHQPVVGAGERSVDRGVATPNIAEMSDADLDKLSDEQLARMRGDYL